MSADRIDSIQCLRGVAAFGVMMSHALADIVEPEASRIARFLFLSGGSGVDLFFLISGFILVISTANSDGSGPYIRDFLARRLLRIWPAYIAATLLFMWIGYGSGVFLYEPAQEKILKSLLFQPLDYSGEAPFYGYAALAVGWTLNYEVYFYLVAAVSMLFRSARWTAMILWILVTVVVVPVAAFDFSLGTNVRYSFGSYLDLMTNPILLHFGVGVLIGLFYKRVPVTLPKPVLGAFVIGAAVICAVMLLGRIRPGHGIAVYGLSYMLLLFTIALADKGDLKIRIPYPLLWLGSISYSLYLVHPIVQYAVPTALKASGRAYLTYGLGMAGATAALSIALAYVFYRVFEIWAPNLIMARNQRTPSVDAVREH